MRCAVVGSYFRSAEDPSVASRGLAAGHPFAAMGGGMKWCAPAGRDQSKGRPRHRQVGVMTPGDHAPCWVRTHSRGPFGQRADFPVTQAVIDIRE
jgi:hypothetical protein